MKGSPFDEVAFFRAVESSGARALLTTLKESRR
jgi:hypothetical protein